MEIKTIGFIGCGNMGSALVENLRKRYPALTIVVFDKDPSRQNSLVKGFGAVSAGSIDEGVNKSDIVVLAVKPQDFKGVLASLKDLFGKTIVSIAAGVTLSTIESFLGASVPIVRAMPNLNLLIGRGVTALVANKACPERSLKEAAEIFVCAGEVVSVKETQMDAVTALSGSGPAFVAYLSDFKDEVLESVFIKEAEHFGLDLLTAKTLVQGTIRGTRQMMAVNFDRDILIKRVASKGGTTEAGLKVLEEHGRNQEALALAIRAAYQRSQELSQRS